MHVVLFVSVMMNCFLGVEISRYRTMVSFEKIEVLNQLAFDLSLDVFGWPVVMFFRFVTSAEIRKRSEFFEPFIMGLANTTVEQV